MEIKGRRGTKGGRKREGRGDTTEWTNITLA